VPSTVCVEKMAAEISMMVKFGIQLHKSNCTVDKVNKTIANLRVYDTDGNLELDESEIRRAIDDVKTAMTRSRDKKVSATLAELRCLLIFIGASLRMWDSNPKHYDACFSKSLPKVFGLISFAGWDPNPKIAKLEKIVCTFYKGGGYKKIQHKIEEAVRDEANGALQEELFGTTFEAITEEILSEAFGDVAADILLAVFI
jgi:hypothetical protein